jgi:murein L,D-transpeptidase YafK
VLVGSAFGLRTNRGAVRAGRGFAVLALLALTALAGCNEDGRLPSNSRHYVPISPQMEALMSEKGMNARSPILLRAYKAESELEVWKQDSSGEYKLLKTFPMCRWSGQLGPKKTEGDRQVPEGFYAITPAQLNPNSAFYLSFNIGYPNTFDRQLGRSGSHIMVHGVCSSRGCFSMTDEQIAEIYALTREAFGGGQKAVQMHSLPFRMTPHNLAKYRADENMPFWKNLKEGTDQFDVSKREVQVQACNGRYRFGVSSCTPTPEETSSSLMAAASEKQREDDRQVAQLIQSGVKPVKRIYQDGDQHPSFKHTIYASTGGDSVRQASIVPQGISRVAEVSQPDALAVGAVEMPHEQTKGLSRQQLLAKAAQAKMQEHAAVAPAAAPAVAATPVVAPMVTAAPALRTTVPAAAGKAAPPTPAPTATALLATETPAKKEEPAFYRRWVGTLGGLTASSEEATEVAPQAVVAPVPPKAPKR